MRRGSERKCFAKLTSVAFITEAKKTLLKYFNFWRKVADLQIRGAPLATMGVKTGTPEPGIGVIDRIQGRRGGQ